MARFSNDMVAPLVMVNAMTELASSIHAAVGENYHALVDVMWKAFGGKQARMVTSFGEDCNHGWRDSGTLDMINAQGADEAEGLSESTTAKLAHGSDEYCEWAIYKETDGRRVLVEIEWAYSDSGAAYGGLFELEE